MRIFGSVVDFVDDQVAMADSYISKTAVTTAFGLYEYCFATFENK